MSIWGGPIEPEIPARDDERPWAIIASLASLFCAVFGPLIIYLVKRGDSPFAARVAAHTLAFNLGILAFNLVFVLFVVAGVLVMMALGAGAPNGQPTPQIVIPIVLFVVGYGVMLLASLCAMILTIIGTIHAASGRVYRYPFVYRFVD